MDAEKVGKRISECRKRAGITQEKLGEAVGFSTNHISAIERGVNMPRVDKLVEMMNVMKCTADEIFIDVLDVGYKRKASILEDKLNGLPGEERRKILNVVEVMIESAKK